jgi:hypothetical protein
MYANEKSKKKEGKQWIHYMFSPIPLYSLIK